MKRDEFLRMQPRRSTCSRLPWRNCVSRRRQRSIRDPRGKVRAGRGRMVFNAGDFRKVLMHGSHAAAGFPADYVRVIGRTLVHCWNKRHLRSRTRWSRDWIQGDDIGASGIWDQPGDGGGSVFDENRAVSENWGSMGLCPGTPVVLKPSGEGWVEPDGDGVPG